MSCRQHVYSGALINDDSNYPIKIQALSFKPVLLIGRLVNEPELVKTETGKKVLTIRLAVQRNFKNPDGIYEADFIRCKLWDGIAERTCEYCHKGDLIAVRGQLRTESYEDDKKEKKYITEVIVDRLNFLVTYKEKEINIEAE